MKASFVDLRKKSGQIIRALDRNEQVTVFYRGRPRAILKPVQDESKPVSGRAQDHPAFGLWKGRRDLKDPAAYVRALRKGRFHDI